MRGLVGFLVAVSIVAGAVFAPTGSSGKPERITQTLVADTASGSTLPSGTDLDRARRQAVPIDGSGEMGIDVVRPHGAKSEVVGWSTTRQVDILADGRHLATVRVEEARLDVARAMGLDRHDVGFKATVKVPADTVTVCIASPGAAPAATACTGTMLDLGRVRPIAFYGAPGVPGLGTLGSGTAEQALARLLTQMAPYHVPERPAVPVFEIIATVAQAAPGADGDYSHPTAVADVWRYLEVIRTVGGHVVLDFQPGRGDYFDQFVAFEELLRQPDVHLALDPEWDMGPTQVPAVQVGHTTAAEINEIMAWLDGIVREERLPPKLLIVHQFQYQMVRDRPDLDPPASVQLLLQMDGHGSVWLKTTNYRLLSDTRFDSGFKVFYARDTPVMTPSQVLALDPEVDLVSYQ